MKILLIHFLNGNCTLDQVKLAEKILKKYNFKNM